MTKPSAKLKIAELAKTGMGNTEIAHTVGVTPRYARKVRAELGLPSQVRPSRAGSVLELVQDGLTNGEIAERLDMTERSVGRIKAVADVPRAAANTPHDSATLTRIRELSDEGWPTGEISETLGLDYKLCSTHGNKHSGKEWNTVARWAARVHPELYRELIA